ncbi:hypothetical protein ACIRPQ_33135 [Streptomyces sp. NPDC101213]|uniref:hypothetical protein n=1 Tax=Streptomyces sp. NPDC101213 TaxID=3366130 RepID=UPI0037F67EF8
MDARSSADVASAVPSETTPAVPDAHRLDPARVAAGLGVGPATGPGTAEATDRAGTHGPNRIAERVDTVGVFARAAPEHEVPARADEGPLPGRHRFRDRALWPCPGAVLAVRVLAVHPPWARAVFGTVPLTADR